MFDLSTGRFEFSSARIVVPQNLIWICIVPVVFITCYYYWNNRRYYQLAAKIPGRTSWPVIGNGLEFMVDHTEILNVLTNLVTDFNGAAKAWIGPHLIVLFSKPEDLEVYYNHPKLMDKGVMYKFFNEALGDGLLTANGDTWKRHRKLLAPTFHLSILKTFVEIFVKQCNILTDVLKRKMPKDRPFDIFPFIRNCSLDLILETAFEENGNAQGEEFNIMTEAAESCMKTLTTRAFCFWMYPDFIFERTKISKNMSRNIEMCINEVQNFILQKRMSQKEQVNLTQKSSVREKKSIASLLLELTDAGSFTDKELIDEIFTIVVTGYETSAATVSFVMLMLGIHQDIQSRLYNEVKKVKVDLDGRPLQADDLKSLEYTEMVIKETLRLFPVGPVTFRTCNDDIQIGKYLVPKGASVGAVVYKTHRDPEIWDNPGIFNPDNFLPENIAKRHPLSFTPFAAGPRSCIGQRYAMFSMKVMIYTLLTEFRVLCDMKFEDIKPSVEITMKCKDGFHIRLEPRESLNQ